MPTISSSQLPPPKNWDEFEDICADVFTREWNDPNTVRHGRQGQRQHGVDIYGAREASHLGVQCKGKKVWPPTPLTKESITSEVEKAKSFTPPLAEFTIATTAENDQLLQGHARKITEEHRKAGLFSVHVLGWEEIQRRLTTYPELVEKHYGFVALASVDRKVDDLQRSVDRILNVVSVRVAPTEAGEGAGPPALTDPAANQTSLAEALERDFFARYMRALRRGGFVEAASVDEFALLATDLRQASNRWVSTVLKRRIFLRAARSQAVRGAINDAETFLELGRTANGEDSILPAEARLQAARGDVAGAVRLLRDEIDPECRGVLLHLLLASQGPADARKWFDGSKISVSELSAGGAQTLIEIAINEHDLAQSARYLAEVTDSQIEFDPNLLFLRACVRFALLFPKADQIHIARGVPLDIRGALPIRDDTGFATQLDLALADFRAVRKDLHALGLTHALGVADRYIYWAEMLHPTLKEAALARLRREMEEPRTAVQFLSFALAFDPVFDPTPIRSYLEKREAFGGLDDDDLNALLTLSFHTADPSQMVKVVAKFRQQLGELFSPEIIANLEIQALAKTGDATSARLILDQMRARLDQSTVQALEVEIAKAEGADPVTEHKKAYERDPNRETLRAFVHALMAKSDDRAVGEFSEKLFELSGDPTDLRNALVAYAASGDEANFRRLAVLHPDIVTKDGRLLRNFAIVQYRGGLLKEARQTLDSLVNALPGERDLQLEVAIAIEMGDWEALASPISAYLAQSSRYSGLELIHAAHLAQGIGGLHLEALIDAAIERSPDDAHVLIGAYSLVLDNGLENKKPEAQEWFRRAIDLSGTDGPVKRFELKELLSSQREWSARTSNITGSVVAGDLPLFIAAPGLRTTLVDVALRGLIQNSEQPDGRKKSILPLFSGSRPPSPLEDVKRIAIDLSAVLTLGWVGLLPKVLETYEQTIIPAGALHELFAGKNRIDNLQRSRIVEARAIEKAVARNQLKVMKDRLNSSDSLTQDVGEEVARLLRAAQRLEGVLLHPAPIRRVSLEDNRVFDASAYERNLIDLHSVLDELVDQGKIDAGTESIARKFFRLQDQRWPNGAKADTGKAIFIDGLSLTYLMTVDLLVPFLDAFNQAYIDVATEQQAKSLIDAEEGIQRIVEFINLIRHAIRGAYLQGKIVFGARNPGRHEQDDDMPSSTFYLLHDLRDVDAVVIDDRAINKEGFAADRQGNRTPVATTLDILTDLERRGAISDRERRLCRHRLRQAGVGLVPVDTEELVIAVQHGRPGHGAEFRAIRESLDLAILRELPQFPAEIRWLASCLSAIKHAIIQVWEAEPDPTRASSYADALLATLPVPDDWIGRWKEPPPGWSTAVETAMMSGLLIPVELSDTALNNYLKWVDKKVVGGLHERSPHTYNAIVEHVKTFVMAISEESNDIDPSE